MPAYVFVEVEVLDKEAYKAYKNLAESAIHAHGGRYLARGGDVEVLEGTSASQRIVILEFPSVAQAKAWWNSPEYAEARILRQKAANARLLIVDGIESGTVY